MDASRNRKGNASDGMNALVVWMGMENGNRDLRAGLLGPDGEVLTPGGFIIAGPDE